MRCQNKSGMAHGGSKSCRGQKRPDHVLSHPLGLGLCLGPHPAVNIEPRVPPRENPLCPFGAEKLLADKVGQTSRPKISAGPESSIRGILWKRPASSTRHTPDTGYGQRFAVLMRRQRIMRANPQRGLPPSLPSPSTTCLGC